MLVFLTVVSNIIPWVPEGFSRVQRKFSVLAAGHYKDLTETGNRARKVSGTQGTSISCRGAIDNALA